MRRVIATQGAVAEEPRKIQIGGISGGNGKKEKMMLAFYLGRCQGKGEREQRQSGCHPSHAFPSEVLHIRECICVSLWSRLAAAAAVVCHVLARGKLAYEIGPDLFAYPGVGNPLNAARSAPMGMTLSIPIGSAF